MSWCESPEFDSDERTKTLESKVIPVFFVGAFAVVIESVEIIPLGSII